MLPGHQKAASVIYSKQISIWLKRRVIFQFMTMNGLFLQSCSRWWEGSLMSTFAKVKATAEATFVTKASKLSGRISCVKQLGLVERIQQSSDCSALPRVIGGALRHAPSLLHSCFPRTARVQWLLTMSRLLFSPTLNLPQQVPFKISQRQLQTSS